MNFKVEKRKLIFLRLLKYLMFLLMIGSIIMVGLSAATSATVNTVISGDFTTVEEPFSILVLGTDTGGTDRSSEYPRADAIMLFSVNPSNSRGNTEVNVTSIPRDTRISDSCTGTTTKINAVMNLSWDSSKSLDENIITGSDCTVQTVEDLFKIDIDYYVTADFNGLVSLIDSVGGIEVNVPYEIVEQDSNGNAGAITLEPGLQTLNGEQALAYARNRKSVIPEKGTSGDDWARNVRQQEIVMLTMAKIIQNPGDYIGSIQELVQSSMWTNVFENPVFVANAAGYAGGLVNHMQNVLSDGQDVMVYYKSAEYGFDTYVSPITDMTGIDLEHTSTYESSEFFGIDDWYTEATTVYVIPYNHLNTTYPTVLYDTEIDPLALEIQMETLSTYDAGDGGSDQIASTDTIYYFSRSHQETLTKSSEE